MMKLRPALNDEERFPLLRERKLLEQLRQDDAAPLFNFASGDRIDAERLRRIEQYVQMLDKKEFWRSGSFPAWLPSFLERGRLQVPAFRSYPAEFNDCPTTRRHELAAAPWNYVSAAADLDELLVYSTSGTTGTPMQVLFDPVSQAVWLAQLESILRADGIRLEGGPERVSICLVCFQQETLTYASLSTWLRGAGILKINLQANEWRRQEDRQKYLEKFNPEVLTGDPFTFQALSELAPQIKPKAMISSAMALQQGLRQTLQEQFGCPVYDLFSLTECRMIACSSLPGRHQLVRPDLYVEILHPDRDEPLPVGERGEIVVSGGINPFLPLLRYRTGDFAAMEFGENGCINLVDLCGRGPVAFKGHDGAFINNVDLARALSRFSLAGYRLHQAADNNIAFTGWGEADCRNEIVAVLARIFGADYVGRVEIKTTDLNENAKVCFSSDVAQPERIL